MEKKREVDEYRRMELPEKYKAKLLYKWDDKEFEEEYLRKLEKNQKRQKEDRQIDKSEHLKMIEENMEEEKEKNKEKGLENRIFFQRRNLKGEVMSRSKKVNLIYFIFLFIFYFLFDLFLYFLFLEQLGLGLINHAVTSAT